GDGAGDVGGAVEVLRTGIDEVELAGRQLAVGRHRHAVVHDGAVGAGARDGVEADLLERLCLAADLLEAPRGTDLVEAAAGGFASEPREKARHGRAVALVSG